MICASPSSILLWRSSIPGYFHSHVFLDSVGSQIPLVLFYLLPLQGYCILLIDLYSFLFSLLLPLLFTTAAFCIMYNGVIPIQDQILAVFRKEAYWVCYYLLASVGLLSDSAF